ncbi:MAG: HPF/RaiA family ribosome-associated protein [Chromatiales bacterium]|nr:MAG: HPF/RaiA family ribosome-associated protein [Chromatiales bacterium]
MNIAVRAQGFELSAAIDTFVRNDIRSTMARFGDEIFSVDVFLKDTNGPKGGIDKQVLLRIQLRGGQKLVLQTIREDLYAAVRVSAKRAKRAIRRNLRKTRRLDKPGLRNFFANAPV